jgi:hypothetical protein
MALVRPCLRCYASLLSAPQQRGFSFSRYDMVDMQRSGAGVQVPRPPKRGSQRAAEVHARVLQIQSGLAGQEKRVADYKKTLPAKTSNRGLLYLCVGRQRARPGRQQRQRATPPSPHPSPPLPHPWPLQDQKEQLGVLEDAPVKPCTVQCCVVAKLFSHMCKVDQGGRWK